MLANYTRRLIGAPLWQRWFGARRPGTAPGKDAADWQAEGDVARAQGNWGAAQAAYNEYLALIPNNFAIWVQLGHALKESGNYSGANTAYLRALALRETDHDLLENIGHLHKLQGNQQSALDFYARSQLIHPNREVERAMRDVRERQAGRFPGVGAPVRTEEIRRIIAGAPLFDAAWYRQTYQDAGLNDGSPLDHYLAVGTYERRSPGPDFDPIWYLRRYGDIVRDEASAHFDPLLHYLEIGKAQGRVIRKPVVSLITAQEVLASVRDLDPELLTNAALDDLSALPIVDRVPDGRAYDNFVRVFRSLPNQPAAIICLRSAPRDDAVIQALAQSGSERILVLICDESPLGAVLPTCGEVVLRFLSDIDQECGIEERAQTLAYLVQAVRPEKILNLNSDSCWEIYARRGRAVSALTSEFAYFQREDTLMAGLLVGPALSHFRDSALELSGVYCDSIDIYDKIVKINGLAKSISSKFIKVDSDLTHVVAHFLATLSLGGV